MLLPGNEAKIEVAIFCTLEEDEKSVDNEHEMD